MKHITVRETRPTHVPVTGEAPSMTRVEAMRRLLASHDQAVYVGLRAEPRAHARLTIVTIVKGVVRACRLRRARCAGSGSMEGM